MELRKSDDGEGADSDNGDFTWLSGGVVARWSGCSVLVMWCSNMMPRWLAMDAAMTER